eukprot:2293194-Rhodomonas_salina.1
MDRITAVRSPLQIHSSKFNGLENLTEGCDLAGFAPHRMAATDAPIRNLSTRVHVPGSRFAACRVPGTEYWRHTGITSDAAARSGYWNLGQLPYPPRKFDFSGIDRISPGEGWLSTRNSYSVSSAGHTRGRSQRAKQEWSGIDGTDIGIVNWKEFCADGGRCLKP